MFSILLNCFKICIGFGKGNTKIKFNTTFTLIFLHNLKSNVCYLSSSYDTNKYTHLISLYSNLNGHFHFFNCFNSTKNHSQTHLGLSPFVSLVHMFLNYAPLSASSNIVRQFLKDFRLCPYVGILESLNFLSFNHKFWAFQVFSDTFGQNWMVNISKI